MRNSVRTTTELTNNRKQAILGLIKLIEHDAAYCENAMQHRDYRRHAESTHNRQ